MFNILTCRHCILITKFKYCNLAKCFPTRASRSAPTGLCQCASYAFENSVRPIVSFLSSDVLNPYTLIKGNIVWRSRYSVSCDRTNMPRRKQNLFRVSVHPSDEPRCIDSEQFLTATSEENISRMASYESANQSDSDSEIVVVYNYKEARTQSAVEIVLDDDDVALEMIPSSSRNMNITRDANNVVMVDSNSSSTRIVNNTARTSENGTSENGAEVSQNNYSQSSEISPEDIESMRSKIEQARFWEYTNLGSGLVHRGETSHQIMFSVLSYNVLSQSLLEAHPHLYAQHDSRALSWEHRSEILLKEFTLANADILCLQEVQESHLTTFYNRLNGLGYSGVYKKRTGDKGDGAAIYFKKSMFTLKEHASVEYYQPNVKILNRDNIGLVVKLAVNGRQDKQIVVATTHLLYNPNRHDIKLAQVQLLLAEIERMAYVSQDRYLTPFYCPTIITGDFNLEPYTGVYRLLTTGMLRYHGLSSKNLCDDEAHRPLSNLLIPSELEVTDTCQHFRILLDRPDVLPHDEQRQRIKLYHSDYSKYTSYKDYVSKMKKEGFVNNFTPQPHTSTGKQRVPPEELLPEGFGTGQLSHHLNLRSVYNHGKYGTPASEVTTFQHEWVTVDYIFYSCKYSPHLDKVIEGNLKLVSRLRLPKRTDVLQRPKIGEIPNAAAPSDHFPLAAVFLLT